MAEEPEDFFDAGEEDPGIDATTDTGRDGRPPRPEAGSDASDGGRDGSPDGDAGRPDADAGKLDAATDAAYAETGSPCSPVNTIQSRACGLCGQQHRVCLDPLDAGAPVWQEWGYCLNEVDGGCEPGSTKDAGCGKCGTMNLTCTKQCTWPTSGSCKNEGPCWPGDIDSVMSLSCDAGLGRMRECNESCEWEAFGACEALDPGITIPTTIGARVGKRVTLTMSPNLGYTYVSTGGQTCSSSYWSEWSNYPGAFVELKNPLNTDATVSVWTYAATGGKVIAADTVSIRVLTAMPNIPPGGIDGGFYGEGMHDCSPDWTTSCCQDTTTDPTACKNNPGCSWPGPFWGGLMAAEGHGVTVPANSSLWIYVQNIYGSADGDLMIGVKTHSF